MLRRLLTAYTGRPPGMHRLVAGPRLKPQLEGGEIHFNVSHSHKRSLLAFAHQPIGVDLEQIRPVPEMDQIVTRNFAPGEQRRWKLLPRDRRELAFFLCWTRKEAYVKALGEGLYRPLDSFEVSLDPGESARLHEKPEWSMYDLCVPGYAAALAIGGPMRTHRAWRLNPASTRLHFACDTARGPSV